MRIYTLFAAMTLSLTSLNTAKAMTCIYVVNSNVQRPVQYEFQFPEPQEIDEIATQYQPPILSEDNLFTQHIRTRNDLEQNVHQSIGRMSPDLEAELSDIFGLGKQEREIHISSKQLIIYEISKDPIANTLSLEAKIKLIHLIHKGYAPPYLAFLIVRYMDEKENPQGLISGEILYDIDTIVLYYTLEKAILSMLEERSGDLSDAEKQSTIEALMNPRRFRGRRHFLYNQIVPQGVTGNLLISAFRTLENLLATTRLRSPFETGIF